MPRCPRSPGRRSPVCALVGAALGIGMRQNVVAADLVVQGVEAIAGLRLWGGLRRLRFEPRFSARAQSCLCRRCRAPVAALHRACRAAPAGQQTVRLSRDFSFLYRKAGSCRGVRGPGYGSALPGRRSNRQPDSAEALTARFWLRQGTPLPSSTSHLTPAPLMLAQVRTAAARSATGCRRTFAPTPRPRLSRGNPHTARRGAPHARAR